MAQYDGIDFKPNDAMKKAASAGLDMRKKHGRGGTEIGIARARDIKNGKALSPSTVRRMKAFFDRHQSDRTGKGWKPGSEGYPSNGRIAWNLWGGDPGYSWSKQRVKQMEARKNKQRKRIDRTERRFVNSTSSPDLSIEYRDDCGPEGCKVPTIRGTAIVFDSLSKDLGGFQERVSPKALDEFFEKHGEDADVAALWSHDVSQVLGRTPTTLKLHRDETGLHFELTPPTSRKDIVELIERQDVRGCSFGFTISKNGGESWEDEDGVAVRTINSIDELFEISLCLSPAYESTKVGAARRSLAGWRRRKDTKAKRAMEIRNKWNASITELKSFVNDRG